MFGYFLKSGYRSILKHRRYSVIGILSLSVGIAILVLVAIFTRNELSVDGFHSNAGQIYKVAYGTSSFTPGPLSGELLENFPEITTATHLETHQLFAFSPVLNFKDRSFEIERYYSADTSFFRIFDFKAVQGDLNSAMQLPFSIALTQSEAGRIFGSQDPVGETMTWKIYGDFPFTVRAILKDPPPNSSIRFNGLISESSLGNMGRHYHDDWGYTSFETYLLLHPDADATLLEQKLRSYLIDYYEANLSTKACYADASTNPLELHPLREVYFNGNLANDTTNRGNLLLIRILLAVGIIIMLLSVINYTNLFLAQGMTRAKETGMQKVCGSGKGILVARYLTETILISFIAGIVGLTIALIILPGFGQFLGTEGTPGPTLPVLVLIIPGIIITGILAGIYPAFMMSSHNVLSMLKPQPVRGRGRVPLRYALIVFQFSVSMIMIAGTLMINSQMTYIKNKDLGIAKEKVVYAKLPFPLMRGNRDVCRDRIMELPGVGNVSFSSTVFGKIINMNSLEEGGKVVDFSTIWTDDEFVELYDLKLLKGRLFSKEFTSDVNATALLNETAVREFDAEDPFRIKIRVPGGEARVIGFLEDFNFKSLHNRIEPMAIVYLPGQAGYVNIRISGSDLQGTLDRIGEIWNDLAPGYPFNYQFLDASLESQYSNDERLSRAIRCFSVIAMIIAILGIYGLSTFIMEKRVKEVAIHKVSGARLWNLLLLFNRNFLIILVVSLGIACPVAWFSMNRWLEGFAYRTSIGIWIYLMSGIIVAIVTLSVVGWQSLYYINKNPVETLRYE